MTAGEASALVVAIATLLSSLAALVVAVRTGHKTDLTHALVNGQASHMEGLAKSVGHAEGVAAATGALAASTGAYVGKLPTGEGETNDAQIGETPHSE